MIPALALVLFAQTTISIGVGTPSHRDSARTAQHRAREDSLLARHDSLRVTKDSASAARRRASLVSITPALLATAFKDPAARLLLDRARASRLAQDSSLKAYDATTYERLSVGMKLGSFGRDRLLMRTERSSRVRWERGKGAVVDVTGARSALPMVTGMRTSVDLGDKQLPIPYFPGRESLWIGSGLAKADVSASSMIHPLAAGSEAYYTYATGDSLSLQLPGGRNILVRELRVEPRKTRWNVVVGSLWFDTSTGQLVRGVFRMAEPMDFLEVAKEEGGEDAKDDIPVLMRPLITPMTGGVDVITVDYGLFDGRFWLPRAQVAEGKARSGVMRFPFSIRQRFEYADVNGDVEIPAVQLTVIDTAHGAGAIGARRAAREAACKNGAVERVSRQTRYDKTLNVVVRVPCDTTALATSSSLPKSIYDTPDALFSNTEMDALVASALSLGRQAGMTPRPPTLDWGLGFTRYNRIEGFSTGVEARQDIGNGYTARALARLGMDLSPNGEIGVTRSNGRESYTANVYRRLNSANDWGRNPFSLGASLSALLFGHDDGVYYRAWGGEIVHEQTGGQSRLVDSWRVFAEQQFDARVHSRFSVIGKLSDGYFPDNIDATNGSIVAAAVRKRGSLGADPLGLRATSDVQLEGGAGSFGYARGMADVTVTRPIVGTPVGPLDAALTLGGGTSVGAVPTQRLWYLGGSSTVRGQDVGVAVGDAYWLSRLELGLGSVAAKPVIFADLGWAGDRRRLTQAVVPVSGAGVGASFLDGLIRLDVAKGIRPTGGVKASLYLDARF
ncbi:MAG: ShlB/FhaC/HecB family hemolysin secretion/activation protein [Gemmatimonadaceae bacterium]